MKATELQQQIAKEICIQLLGTNVFCHSSIGNNSPEEFNTQVGQEVGSLYQALLAKIAETETI